MRDKLRHMWLNRRAVPTMIAFRLLRRAMAKDAEYAWSWHCNIAMSAHDEGTNPVAANRAAARFMRLCFNVDTQAIH